MPGSLNHLNAVDEIVEPVEHVHAVTVVKYDGGAMLAAVFRRDHANVSDVHADVKTGRSVLKLEKIVFIRGS